MEDPIIIDVTRYDRLCFIAEQIGLGANIYNLHPQRVMDLKLPDVELQQVRLVIRSGNYRQEPVPPQK